MTLKDFSIVTRSRSAAAAINGRDALEAISIALLRAEMPSKLSVSLSSLTNPIDGKPQMTFDV